MADVADAFLRIKGARDLPPRALAILREVHGWREQVAEERDQAPDRHDDHGRDTDIRHVSMIRILGLTACWVRRCGAGRRGNASRCD